MGTQRAVDQLRKRSGADLWGNPLPSGAQTARTIAVWAGTPTWQRQGQGWNETPSKKLKAGAGVRGGLGGGGVGVGVVGGGGVCVVGARGGWGGVGVVEFVVWLV